MDYDTLKQKLESESDLYLFDIREPAELVENKSPVPAVHKPMGQIFREAASKQLPNDIQIVVFCASGSRGSITAEFLRSNGYDALNLEGGYMAMIK